MADPLPMQDKYASFALTIDRITTSVGKTVAWLLVAMVLLESVIVVMRYGFDIGFIALQESVTYMHAAVFLLGAAYTLKEDGHVRVDIYYRNFSARRRAWLNLIGTACMLIPLTLFIIWSSFPYVAQAWSIKEASADAGGIPAVYLLKTLMPLFAALLLLQGIAEILKALSTITVTSSSASKSEER